jgi:asparagine synthase (glutamine-hydrolysing)
MCGLAGWLGSPSDVIDEGSILTSLAHRGPDGAGVKTWPSAGLLHTRLKIIDLSPTGAQPMANEDSSVFVVFNGEIYNHRSLRRKLEAGGHVFRGTSDTEVLPHLYEEYGRELFNHIRGMFAVAIYDVEKRLLLLGRDRFGIKPLFYAPNRRFLAFASELNALRLVPGVDLAPDPQAISDYAALLYVPAPRTIFHGIKALAPGTLLEAQVGRGEELELSTHSYHRWTMASRDDLTLDEAVDEADALVEEAVARQLESDVPLGALLSGGIDSSLVSAAARRRGNGTLETFNAGFAEPVYDETPAARAVAEHIGSHHRTLNMPERTGTWEHVTSLLRHAGQPFADTSLFAVAAVSEAMRQQVTVALSGDGGDEGFGGYDYYKRLGAVDRLRRLPLGVVHAASLAARVAAQAGVVRSSLPHRLREFSGADDTSVVEAFFRGIRGGEHERLVTAARELDPPRRLFERQWDGSYRSELDRLFAHTVEVNMRLVLPNDFLFKVDAASMRHSLEVRVPMLDEDLVAFGLSLPHTLRANRKAGKIVLRRLSDRRLPPAIARRRKQGFAIPVDRWVDRDFKDNLRLTLSDPASCLSQYLNRDAYAPWVDAFCSDAEIPGLSRSELYQRIMMLLALDLTLKPQAQSR